MSIVKRNHVVFPSLMHEFFKPDWFGGIENHRSNYPAVNIKDLETEFELSLAIPGLKKDDFNIEVDKNVLTISSEVKTESETKDDNYTRKEFSFASFKRAFTLPETVDEDGIKANYENGILEVVIPKRKEALPKPKRLISIK